MRPGHGGRDEGGHSGGLRACCSAYGKTKLEPSWLGAHVAGRKAPGPATTKLELCNVNIGSQRSDSVHQSIERCRVFTARSVVNVVQGSVTVDFLPKRGAVTENFFPPPMAAHFENKRSKLWRRLFSFGLSDQFGRRAPPGGTAGPGLLIGILSGRCGLTVVTVDVTAECHQLEADCCWQIQLLFCCYC